jgi:hypothetical protein
MIDILVAAVIACSTGEATCTSYDLEEYTLVHVCDIAPDETGQKKIRATVKGEHFVVTLDAQCVGA